MQIKSIRYTVKMFLLLGCLLTISISSLSAKTIFQDNFDSKKLNPKWNIERGDWEIEEGCLVNKGGGKASLDVGKERGWAFSCKIKTSEYERKYLEFNILFTEETGEYYQLLLCPSKEKAEKGFYYIWHRGGNGILKNTLGFSYFSEIGQKFNLNEWHKIKVIFTDGGLLYFYLNGKLVKKTFSLLSPRQISFSGSRNGNLFIDEVMIEGYISLTERKKVFYDTFSNLSLWNLAGQKNGKKMVNIEGQSLKQTKHKGVCLHYYFTTSGHDAVYITRENLFIPSGNILSLTVNGDNSKHRLFAVLKDRSGEFHVLQLSTITWEGEKTVYQNFDHLKVPPVIPETRSATHWGGDNNQVLDYPITSITIGINDKPDIFRGEGDIYFKRIDIFEALKQ